MAVLRESDFEEILEDYFGKIDASFFQAVKLEESEEERCDILLLSAQIVNDSYDVRMAKTGCHYRFSGNER